MELMIVAGVAIVGFGAAMIWYLFARGSQATTVSERDFDAVFADLVAKGEFAPEDRDAAWRDFHGWQAANEKERLAWEEPIDE